MFKGKREMDNGVMMYKFKQFHKYTVDRYKFMHLEKNQLKLFINRVFIILNR